MRSVLLGSKRAWNATATIALAATLATSGAGCGFLFSQGPPDGYERQLSFDCGESSAPAVLDTVAAALGGINTAITASPANHPNETAAAYRTDIALNAGLVVLSAASAIYGYQASAACRAARRQRLADWARAQANLTGPGPYR